MHSNARCKLWALLTGGGQHVLPQLFTLRRSSQSRHASNGHSNADSRDPWALTLERGRRSSTVGASTPCAARRDKAATLVKRGLCVASMMSKRNLRHGTPHLLSDGAPTHAGGEPDPPSRLSQRAAPLLWCVVQASVGDNAGRGQPLPSAEPSQMADQRPRGSLCRSESVCAT